MNLLQKCSTFADEILKDCDKSSDDELSIIRGNTLRFLNECFNERLSTQEPVLSYIAADSIIVEIIDNETKQCFRRDLPVRYEETGNGISLIGEDITGKSTQISFLSEAAYEKIKDLTGKGINAPRCGEHD